MLHRFGSVPIPVVEIDIESWSDEVILKALEGKEEVRMSIVSKDHGSIPSADTALPDTYTVSEHLGRTRDAFARLGDALETQQSLFHTFTSAVESMPTLTVDEMMRQIEEIREMMPPYNGPPLLPPLFDLPWLPPMPALPDYSEIERRLFVHYLDEIQADLEPDPVIERFHRLGTMNGFD